MYEDENILDYKFYASISTEAYKTKPTDKATIAKMKFTEQSLTVGEMIQKIRQGFNFTGIFKHNGDIMTATERKQTNFIKSYYIGVDCDEMTEKMSDFVSNLPIVPTIAYTTPTNNKTINGKYMGYRYRIIYVLDYPLECTPEEYHAKYKGLLKCLNIDGKRPDGKPIIKDNCGGDCSRFFNGSPDCDYIISDTILDANFIRPIYEETEKQAKQKTVTKPENITTTAPADLDFFADWHKLTNIEILEKYQDVYKWNRATTLQSDENGIEWITPDYIELKPYWKRDGEGKPMQKKIEIGHRNATLYREGCFIRKINPEISLAGLCLALLEMFVFHCENSDKELNRDVIFKKATDIMKKDINNIYINYRDNRKFKVNAQVAEQLGKTKQKLAAEERTRQHDNEIGLYFDVFKSDKDNLKVLKENGVKVSDNYLKGFRERTNSVLSDVQTEYIQQATEQGKADKDIIKDLNISKRTFYRLKDKIRSAKNGDQDIKLKSKYFITLIAKNDTKEIDDELAEQYENGKSFKSDFKDTFDSLTADEIVNMLGLQTTTNDHHESDNHKHIENRNQIYNDLHNEYVKFQNGETVTGKNIEIRLDDEAEKVLELLFG